MTRVLPWGLALFLVMAPALTSRAQDEDFRQQRLAMVDRQIKARGVKDPQVLKALTDVPRHEFVPKSLQSSAYADHPLPIGYGQTISQPYIVAYMTELLELKNGDKVLEIGTGSGYQAAVLAQITDQVFSVEIIPPLYKMAKERLARLKLDRIRLKEGDGYFGWPEHAPFDAIIVTCAAGHIPPPLLKQLKPGGRMVIPVGQPMFVQELVLATKDAGGRVSTRSLLPVRFVPLLRKKAKD
ncbi:MAG: protein-L-isoaspartate(D-aspartate) O-methyltransferase [Desulfarculaceae bacterium]|jgi:protein-L-isoaspartate(D-aspartate) O-methyltransferase